MIIRDHAKLLWQRIPTEVKDSNAEIKELWEIGKKLWRREFPDVYSLAQSPSWPSYLEPIVSSLLGQCELYISRVMSLLSTLLTEQVRQRVINLVRKAYKTIKLSDLCSLLGQSEEQVKQGVQYGRSILVT